MKSLTKYKLDPNDTKDWFGTTLYRIICVTPFDNIAEGGKGGEQ